ncbi:MAG: hypothetical protein QXQ30_00920 [Candidatus Pacearchaeota archaeon]
MQLSKIDLEKIKYLKAFSHFTNITTTECFKFNERIIYIVNPALLKILLLRKKSLKKLSKFLNKKIKVLAIPLEKNKENIKKFIDALISPYKIKTVEIENSKIIIYAGITKSILLGKEKKNLQLLKEIFKKYFKIEEIEIR